MPGIIVEPREQDGRREYGIAGALLIAAFVLYWMPASPQQWISTGLRSTVLAPFLWVQQQVASARVQAVQSTRLQALVDSLSATVLDQEAVVEENHELRALLGLAARMGRDFVPASVVRSGTAGSESVFMLDVGRADGVEEHAPVVIANGLIGVVWELRERSALAIDWTHPEFRASAMTEDGITYGFVEPRAGPARELDRMVLNGAPYHSDVKPGTAVVASGYGGVFPRGIPIGWVDEVAEIGQGWRKAYWVRPAVLPAQVTHVLVAIGSTRLPREGEPRVWWRDLQSDVPNPFDSAVLETLPPVGER